MGAAGLYIGTGFLVVLLLVVVVLLLIRGR